MLFDRRFVSDAAKLFLRLILLGGSDSVGPTFDADGDALAQRLPDQVPGGQRQLLAWQQLCVSWKSGDGHKA